MSIAESIRCGLAVLDAFMDALNRRDERALNDTLNFPHVRIAGGRVAIFAEYGDYRLDTFLARAGEGWGWSRWDERAPVHAGPDKIHFAVRFTRCDAAGLPLASYRAIWIVTCAGGHWGVQARSSFAP